MRKVWRCGTIPPKPTSSPSSFPLPSSLPRIGSSVAGTGFDLTMWKRLAYKSVKSHLPRVCMLEEAACALPPLLLPAFLF